MSPEAPRIRRIEPFGPRGLKVRVHTSAGEPFEVALEALERARLGVGDALTGARRRGLDDLDARVRVRDAALHLIAYRARTRRELHRRLTRKGFSSERIDTCLDDLEARGLLDDASVAAAFVRDRLRHRPRGQARLGSELRRKGVSPDLARSVIDTVFREEETSDEALALEVVAGWLVRQGADVRAALAEARGPETERARRRLRGYLGRRGFHGDALRAAMDRAVALALSERGGP